ncbi:ribonuclease P protein component [Mycoplasmopsis fermentans]|nr:ribonuclease P protein component [Mycoplasmopsis fermentans]VEU67011.1 Ribonuclease P protein component [Mesomycoplasma conjunctivae]ADV34990.1 Ribonuclease P protein component [Mycoplasmopsis fermentans M64]RMX34613.1 ribonuclease P protein component [Mycoplasmopsis fermentans MF-I1]RMX34651.1 ribonuclease P protein component [Mycoplasmopsis fermentans MF-I2]VEU59982.1 Ribonuclease P protein component [Mycoplasmopsis fermentans]
MKKIYRLQKSWEFDAVIKFQKQVLNKYMIIYYMPNDDFKIGITVPKKFCNAVLRNYYKRQLKSIIHSLNLYGEKMHFVLIPRKDFLNLIYEDKLTITKKLFEKIKNGKQK